jgi:hypothetical protein
MALGAHNGDDDHGIGAGGECSAKSEISDPGDQGRCLVVEWTTDV